MMRTYNISYQFLQIFQLLYDGVIFCWRFLDSIKVLSNVSLLDICISSVLILTFLPIIIGLAGRGASSSKRYYKSKKRSSGE